MKKILALILLLLLAVSLPAQVKIGGTAKVGGTVKSGVSAGGGGASLNKGFNFRATTTFVTDGANETYVLSTTTGPLDSYPTTRNGVTFGWTPSGPSDLDRNSGNDRRLAGIHYVTNGGTPLTFRVDMTAGTYVIHLAIGDPNSAHSPQYVEIYDNTTLRATIDSSSNSNEFLDATGVARTAANWPSQNVGLSVNVSSGILNLKVGKLTGTDVTSIAHLYID